MILKASQRGGSGRMAAHLLNTDDNEHVEIHEVSGFISDTLPEAMQETYAISKGTRCKQFLFSVSLSPPQNEPASLEVFENALSAIEREMKLENQPRVIVFHEKQGHRHAHAVWSRIDTQKMKAINLPFFKNKLMDISKDIYLEQGWKLPQGFIDRTQRNPFNFTREQWQQTKRLNDNPKVIKRALKESWTISKTKDAFVKSLEQKGYYLAKGDRRGYVAVDWRGEVYSLSKWLNLKNKALKEKLNETKLLPSVDKTKAKIDHKLVERMQNFTNTINQNYNCQLAPLLLNKKTMQLRHGNARKTLSSIQEIRWQKENKERNARFNTGVLGIWERINGKHAKIKQQNEMEAYQGLMRARTEKDTLIQKQLQERGKLQCSINNLNEKLHEEIHELKTNLFSKLPDEKIIKLERKFNSISKNKI